MWNWPNHPKFVTLSVIQYALLMDDINKEIIKEDIGPKLDCAKEPIGCLLWMEDVALISNDPKELQKMLNITNEVANRYHIEFGSAKSKILKIGNQTTKPDIYLGEYKLEYTDNYKYLGEMLNHKGNAEDHIIQLKRKTEAAYQTILAVLGNQYFNKIELETAWKLLETCIQPILTYGGETMNTTKKEQRKINQIQENIIRRILMVPQSTPIEALYMETGLLDITTIITKNRFNMEKRLHKHPENITTKIMETNTTGGWKETTTRMREHINETLHNTKNEYINPQQLKRYFRHNIQKTSGGKTKIQFLRENTNWKTGERPKYMKELKRTEASTIFKARTRMLDVKNNFKGKYKDTKCRKCTETVESQEHVLETCTGIHDDDTTKITINDIFDSNPNNLKTTAKQITKILDKLNN